MRLEKVCKVLNVECGECVEGEFCMTLVVLFSGTVMEVFVLLVEVNVPMDSERPLSYDAMDTFMETGTYCASLFERPKTESVMATVFRRDIPTKNKRRKYLRQSSLSPEARSRTALCYYIEQKKVKKTLDS